MVYLTNNISMIRSFPKCLCGQIFLLFYFLSIALDANFCDPWFLLSTLAFKSRTIIFFYLSYSASNASSTCSSVGSWALRMPNFPLSLIPLFTIIKIPNSFQKPNGSPHPMCGLPFFKILESVHLVSYACCLFNFLCKNRSVNLGRTAQTSHIPHAYIKVCPFFVC